MRALVTGADGFLGANLCARLVADGHDVTGAALNRQGRTALDALGVDVRLEYGDVTDRAYVERIVNASEAEIVYHLAAVSIVRVAERHPARCLTTNILGTVNVCEAALRSGASVVVASSDKAYGDNGGAVYSEDTPLRPTGAYEVSKASADMIARCYASQHGLRAMVTRCANLYGPGDLNWSRLVPNSCRLAVRGQPPEVHPSAWQYEREWVYVDDAVDAYLAIATAGVAGQAYNVGSGQYATAGAVARQIARVLDAPEPVDSGMRIGYEIPAQRLDTSLLRRELGAAPETPLSIGLRRTCDWYWEYVRGEGNA